MDKGNTDAVLHTSFISLKTTIISRIHFQATASFVLTFLWSSVELYGALVVVLVELALNKNRAVHWSLQLA